MDTERWTTVQEVAPKEKRKRYDEEFKKDAVRLLQNRGTRTVADIAAQLGVHTSLLIRWRQDYAGAVRGEAVKSQEQRDEVEQLRRRLRELEAENSLLKKAAALIAKDVK